MNASNGMACDIFFSPLVALLSMYHFFPMDLQTIENKSMCFYSGNQLQKMRTVYLIYYDFSVFKQYTEKIAFTFLWGSRNCVIPVPKQIHVVTQKFIDLIRTDVYTFWLATMWMVQF